MRVHTFLFAIRKSDPMTIIGYLRVSSDKQDLEQQEHLLLKYAQQQGFAISEFVAVEISSRKTPKERRIEELMSKLYDGDMLLVAELSRLGRNMFEVLEIINRLSDNGVQIVFIRQPELSTAGPHGKLLLAIYSYFAETERELISIRTKQGLDAARAKGKTLGRPKGSRDKHHVLDPYRDRIRELLELKMPLLRISSILNEQMEKPVSYNSYQYFVRQDPELLTLWQAQRGSGSNP
jgi:DNA invertase Pin-like site-specific DNA recombinase